MLQQAVTNSENYDLEKDTDLVTEDDGTRKEAMELYCKAGQSRRVWGELYKVSDKCKLNSKYMYIQ